MKIFLIIAVVVIVVLSGGLVLVGPKLASGLGFSSAPTGTVVRWDVIETGQLTETVPAPGDIEPYTKVEISSEIVGKIEALPFREGELVHVGDLVVKLDDKDLQAALMGSKASLESAQASLAQSKASRDRTGSQLEEQQGRRAGLVTNLNFARRNHERKKELFASGDIALADIELAEERVSEIETQIGAADSIISGAESSLAVADAQIRQAEAAVKRAEADIERTEDALNNTTIYSPIDGHVTLLNAEVGESVVAGTMNSTAFVIMTIADLSEMTMKARVAESDVAKIAEGQSAQIFINAYPEEEFSGTVQRIALQRTGAGDGTGFFETEISVDLDGRRVLSGCVSNVEIDIGSHQGIVIPSQAVVDRLVEDLPRSVIDDNPLVDRAKKAISVVYRVVDGKAIATPVKVGPSDYTHTLIQAGLDIDDRVITGPYKVLDVIKHEQRVRQEDGLNGGAGDGGSDDAGEVAADDAAAGADDRQ